MPKWLDRVTGGDAATPSPEQKPNGKPDKAVAKPREPASLREAAVQAAVARQKQAKPDEPPLPPPTIMLEESDPAALSSGLLTRQVILGRKFQPEGYVFALRADESLAHLDPLTRDRWLLDIVERLGVERLCRYRALWLPVSPQVLGTALLNQLPPASTVLMVDIGNTQPSPETMVSAALARGRGFRLCLADFRGTTAQKSWLLQADYLEIDSSRVNPIDAGVIPEKLLKAGVAAGVLASHLESQEDFEFCHKANYMLFRGDFLTRREPLPRNARMAPDRVTVCTLLNKLRAGAEIDEVAEPFRTSPELAYRFLRYINSVGFGLTIKVASVKQGMVYLGRNKLYRWLTLLLFNPEQSRSIDAALLEQSLVRARMMEQLGEERLTKVAGDELFIVGMFSMLDVLLKLPMSVALDPLKLPEAVQGALVDDSGDYAPYLRLAMACEANDARLTAEQAGLLGFTVDHVNTAHFEALAFAQETLTPDPALR
jgi:EAL and modified HD-GYP domain-containing signal transduction protein